MQESRAPQTKQAPLARRLMWFALLYIGGVAAVAALAYALRFVTR
ncbi:MAG TPA: DUF2474 domain-containing protein [Rhodoblastus sp.]|nr:DUF2474 domain-containing protein [Rhodoblastus sp.]